MCFYVRFMFKAGLSYINHSTDLSFLIKLGFPANQRFPALSIFFLKHELQNDEKTVINLMDKEISNLIINVLIFFQNDSKKDMVLLLKKLRTSSVRNFLILVFKLMTTFNSFSTDFVSGSSLGPLRK